MTTSGMALARPWDCPRAQPSLGDSGWNPHWVGPWREGYRRVGRGTEGENQKIAMFGGHRAAGRGVGSVTLQPVSCPTSDTLGHQLCPSQSRGLQ